MMALQGTRGFLRSRDEAVIFGERNLGLSPQVPEASGRLSPDGGGGDALRILERSGVIAQAVLTEIHRQRIPELRGAIEDLSKGRTSLELFKR